MTRQHEPGPVSDAGLQLLVFIRDVRLCATRVEREFKLAIEQRWGVGFAQLRIEALRRAMGEFDNRWDAFTGELIPRECAE